MGAEMAQRNPYGPTAPVLDAHDRTVIRERILSLLRDGGVAALVERNLTHPGRPARASEPADTSYDFQARPLPLSAYLRNADRS
jgi:hypothetical protein